MKQDKLRPILIVGLVAGGIYALTRWVRAAPPIIYTCPYCGIKFTTEAELLAHITAQHPEQPPEVWYTCPYCGITFSSQAELNAHIQAQHTYTCPYCSATFLTEAELNYHIQTQHPVAVAKFYMPSRMEVIVTDGSILDMYWNCEFSCQITNKGTGIGTHTIIWYDNVGVRYETAVITLNPGQSYLWKISQWVRFDLLPRDYGVYAYIITLEGDWEGNNISIGEARP